MVDTLIVHVLFPTAVICFSSHNMLLYSMLLLCSVLLSFNHPLPSWVARLSFFPSQSRVCSTPGWEHWFGRGTDMRQHQSVFKALI